jgi:DNA damage-inducible protein 1
MLLLVKHATNDSVTTLEIPGDEDIYFLKELIQIECGVPLEQQVISFNGKVLSSGSIVSNCLVDGSELKLDVGAKRERAICIGDIPATTSPEELLKLVSQHPHLLLQYQNADPELGSVIESRDTTKLRTLMMKRYMGNHKRAYDQKQEMDRIWSNPDDEENQKKIAEMIRLEAINANMEAAMESMPEAFGRVVMLYVDIKVNSIPVKCFVDSGAQMTIMTQRCVENCKLSHLVDTRFRGEARGVGSAKILGKIHIVQMELGNGEFYPVSITVLEGGDVDCLLGLDMLKRHRAIINLSDSTLKFEGSSAVSFLAEKDMPTSARGHDPSAEAAAAAASSSSSSSSSVVPAVTELPVAASSPTAMAPPAPPRADLSNILNLTGPAASREDKVSYLCGLGFSNVESNQALDQANGDIELAVSLLLLSRG